MLELSQVYKTNHAVEPLTNKTTMKLKEQCKMFRVKLEPIARETQYTLPYVGMVVRGKRFNSKILSAVHLALEEQKKVYRKMLT